MRPIFVDTDYWIATLIPSDELHTKAISVLRRFSSPTLITSDMVLAEVLNTLASRGAHLRDMGVKFVADVTSDAAIEVVPQTRLLFRDALALYGDRLDKKWSLTDCASFVIMRTRSITEALTHDHHFEQNGYVALLR
jgi:predicted nucleic acid-binding protein